MLMYTKQLTINTHSNLKVLGYSLALPNTKSRQAYHIKLSLTLSHT